MKQYNECKKQYLVADNNDNVNKFDTVFIAIPNHILQYVMVLLLFLMYCFILTEC